MKDEKPSQPILSILILEDNLTDVEIVIQCLHHEGYEIMTHHVSTEKTFLEKLQTYTYDLILSDYNLPGYSGMAALKRVMMICPETPFICVSGNIGENLAVELLKEGVADYVSKDKLEKLPLAINRVLGEIQKQRDLQNAESELLRLSQAVYQSPSAITITDITGAIIYNNPKFSEISGYTLNEVAGKSLRILKKGNTFNEVHTDIWNALKSGNVWQGEYLSKRKDSELFWEHTTISPILDSEGKTSNFLAISEDITEKKQTEQAIIESEQTFRLLFQNNPLCMWVYDIESLKFLSVNQTTIQKYGYSEEEFFALSILDILAEDETRRLTEFLNQQDGEIQNLYGWHHRLKDGKIIDVEITTHSIIFRGKKAKLVVAIDVTERVTTEREIKKLSQAVQQSPVSIIMTDINGNIEYVNDKTEEMSGYSNMELSGKNPRIFNSGEKSQQEYAEFWNTIKKGDKWSGEFHNRKKNGELYWESATISPIINKKGEITQFLAIKEDITERKKLTEDLIISKEKAEASDRLKTAFLHNISHEIRTPLNGILGFATLINDPNLDTASRERYFNILNKSSDRLLNTITGFMDISLLTSGTQETHLRPTKIGYMLDEIFELFSSKCSSKGLEMKLDISKEVQVLESNTDQALIEKALSHLLDNAIKFTDEGTVTLSSHIENDKLCISVIDTGIGIKKEAQATIFGTFIQENIESNHAYEGSGLGLSIAEGVVNLLGGSIHITSEMDKGSKFTIILPLAQICKEKISYESAIPKTFLRNESSKTILVVEDDDLNYNYIDIVVESEGLTVIRGANGLEAVQQFKLHPEISLILMDIKMPIMDGYEATRQIKALNPTVPIIALTAFAQSGDKEKAIEAGCNEYLSKPVQRINLLAIIHKYLNFSTLPS